MYTEFSSARYTKVSIRYLCYIMIFFSLRLLHLLYGDSRVDLTSGEIETLTSILQVFKYNNIWH